MSNLTFHFIRLEAFSEDIFSSRQGLLECFQAVGYNFVGEEEILISKAIDEISV